ncbi:MAG: glycosyltransferase [Janthinobacterium lividum]
MDNIGGSGAPPLLLHAFPSFAVGGVQARFATIVNHFGRRWRHAIVAMDGNYACRERLDPALDVSYPPLRPMPGDTLGSVRQLRGLLQTLRPAKLITSNWGTIDWAIANRLHLVPHVHVEDGFGPDERHRQLPRRVWMRRVFLARRTVVVPSTTLRAIATDIWRLNPARIRYVPNGIDLVRFGSGPVAPPPAGATEGPVIGTVAALRAEKNVARLLRAFKLDVPGRLLIIGDGPERGALQALASELGIAARVHWAGHQPDPAALLRSLDIFALSSDTEQMPLSLLEAMAAALPVAATAVGDVAAMLPPEQQPYVVPLDDAALAASLRGLAIDAALRTRLGQANRQRAEAQYDQRTMLANWAELFS